MTDLSNEQWAQARKHFEACLELPQSEREKCLATIESPQIVSLVRRMLAADDEDSSALQVVSDLAQKAMPHRPKEETASLADTHIGPYRVLTELGRGGMSTVYLAERSDGKFQQKVAVKVLRKGLDTNDILNRFENEKHILASLHHPNVARLLDAHELPDGRPCFLLEYIEGMPLDRYCDRNRLTIHQRIQLFLKVCDAVAFAHERLILHRDIKPSNILVDDRGNLKLLDFGIAKVLQAEGSGEDPKTRTEHRMMTPEYASPEQIKGLATTTASDIYALGVVLFQLLTGMRPENPLSSATGATTQTASTKKPSAVFSQGTDPQELAALCKSRQVGLDQARRLLRGDLDTILSVALHQEPSRRFGSVAQLREDLKRFLEGLPISVRGDSPSYLLKNFLGRHKLAVSLMLLALVSLTIGLATSIYQYRQASTQRDLAQKETLKADRVVELLTEVFTTSNPLVSKGKDLTAREILDRGSASLLEDLTEEPEVQTRLLKVVGTVYRNLAVYDRASVFMSKALEIQQETFGEQHQQVGVTHRELGLLYFWQGKYTEAEDHYRKALAIHRAVLPGDHIDLALDLVGLGGLLLNHFRLQEAETVLLEAVAIYNRLPNPDPQRRLVAYNNLAVCKYHQNKFDEAKAVWEQVLAQRIALTGEIHQSVASTLNNIGKLLFKQGHFEEAEVHLKRSLRIKDQVYGEESRSASISYHNLGELYQHMRRYPEAIKWYEKAIDAKKKWSGERHSSTYFSKIHRVATLFFAGKVKSAESSIPEIRDYYQETVGKEHSRYHLANLWYALLLFNKGQYPQVLETLEETWQYHSAKESPSIPKAMTQTLYGAALVKNGRDDEGWVLFRRGKAVLNNFPATGNPHLDLAEILEKQLL